MNPRSSRRRPISEINVVPYIDVTLVLLIIFMITAPLLQTGVEVDLPQAEAKPIEEQSDPPLIVSIDADGRLFLDVGDRQDEPLQPGDLTVKVVAVLRHKPDTSVFVRGDARVGYGKVVAVMAALKKAGIAEVGLITRPVEER
jgi:biopolymer transport protein TolR